MPPPSYSYETFVQAKQTLSQRLYDTSKSFWLDIELGAYLTEALQAWQCYARFWRGEFSLDINPTRTWFDITNTFIAPATLRPFVETPNQLQAIICYHLLEPVSQLGSWLGSSQFTQLDMLDSFTRRRDELLSLTGCYVTRITVPTTPNNTRNVLPGNIIDVIRMAFIDVNNQVTPLFPADVQELEAYDPEWTSSSSDTPSTYLLSTEPPLNFDVDVAPTLPGQYEVICVVAGNRPTRPATVADFAGIPDDFIWVLKWGILADLLSKESDAKDIVRASYCTMRYRQGIELLLNSPAILSARINGAPVMLDSVVSADQFNVSWQSQSPVDVPTDLLTAGLNLIAVVPQATAATPPASQPSLFLSVVENAPLPVADGDFIQLSQDDLDVIIDYAQHLATFKMGGAEFLATMPLFKRFLQQAAVYNSKLSHLGAYRDVIQSESQREESDRPRFAHDILSPEAANG